VKFLQMLYQEFDAHGLSSSTGGFSPRRSSFIQGTAW
jgi:hypothetical protein